LCKWRRDNKGKKKPIQNELVEEKVEDDGTKKQEMELVQVP